MTFLNMLSKYHHQLNMILKVLLKKILNIKKEYNSHSEGMKHGYKEYGLLYIKIHLHLIDINYQVQLQRLKNLLSDLEHNHYKSSILQVSNLEL